MKQFFVEHEGIKVRINEWGCEENSTIICLHGLGSTSLSFLELGELLCNKYHIFSIDLPGHGKTPPFEREEDYGIPNLMNWLSKVISVFEKGSFFVMAHSWGGCVALHYAAKFPEKVKKILLIDGGYHVKQMQYDYFSNKELNETSIKPLCSLEDEIRFYEADFDGYVFSCWDDLLKVEKNNYLRWSKLMEQAVKDLMMEEEDGTIRFCVSGDTARDILISMNNFPISALYGMLHIPIMLLQATLPEFYDEVRTIQVKEFQKGTSAIVKRIEATHLLHWDNPFIVAEEAVSWMK